MRKTKINNPDDFYIGRIVKLPFGGWWFGVQGNVWVRGKIVKISKNDDGKVKCIITKCYHKKYGNLGRFMSFNEQCDNIYKTK